MFTLMSVKHYLNFSFQGNVPKRNFINLLIYTTDATHKRAGLSCADNTSSCDTLGNIRHAKQSNCQRKATATMPQQQVNTQQHNDKL